MMDKERVANDLSEFMDFIDAMADGRKPDKLHISPAFLLALSDEQFIAQWGGAGNESEYFIIDQPVGIKIYNEIKERCKILNLT